MNSAHRQIPCKPLLQNHSCNRQVSLWRQPNQEKVKKHHNHVGQTKEEEGDDDANCYPAHAHFAHTIILCFMMKPLEWEELFDNPCLLPNKFHPAGYVSTWLISPFWAYLHVLSGSSWELLDMTSMAITHADLENGRGCGLTGGKAGSMVIVLCVFAALLGFIFCLLSELTRSEVLFSNLVFFLPPHLVAYSIN